MVSMLYWDKMRDTPACMESEGQIRLVAETKHCFHPLNIIHYCYNICANEM